MIVMGGFGMWREIAKVVSSLRCLKALWGYEPDRWLAGLSVDAVLFGEAGTGNVVGCVDLVSLHKILAHVF